jgi:hypothetical protein
VWDAIRACFGEHPRRRDGQQLRGALRIEQRAGRDKLAMRRGAHGEMLSWSLSACSWSSVSSGTRLPFSDPTGSGTRLLFFAGPDPTGSGTGSLKGGDPGTRLAGLFPGLGWDSVGPGWFS